VGLGEVGRPLFELLRKSGVFDVYGLDVDESKMFELGLTENIPEHVDVMHICIPCASQKDFRDAVIKYVEEFRPNLLVINSTVPPGTTFEISRRCKCLVSHSPIFGTHRSKEHMKWEMRRWTKIVGGVNDESSKMTCEHFQRIGIKTRILKSPIETELAKLLETIYSALMIAFFQEMHRISRFFNADFDEIVSVIEQIHSVRLDRPIWYPGVIGGHCLIPNTELLLKVYESEFLRLILKSNEKRKKEMEDENIRIEVEKIRKRVEALEKEFAKREK
jgi:UDP-N-acetyl-D-mannosaminuronate dehydrogenase